WKSSATSAGPPTRRAWSSASAKSIASACAWCSTLPSIALARRAPSRLPTQRSAIRLCRTAMVTSRLVLPGAVLDLDHHARALVEAEMIGGRHVEDSVRAGDLARSFER